MSKLKDPRAAATANLFERYALIIEATPREAMFDQDSRLSLENLLWICRQGEREADILPLDKISRWLGFVQGCLAMRGLIQVDEERDVSRPIFHKAYREAGITVPDPRQK